MPTPYAPTNTPVTQTTVTGSSTSTGQIGAPVQVKAGSGSLVGVANVIPTYFTTTAVAALTTTQIGTFYDGLLASTALASLTTTQVATLSTTQLLALSLPTITDYQYQNGQGLPFQNGLIFSPGSGQQVNITYK